MSESEPSLSQLPNAAPYLRRQIPPMLCLVIFALLGWSGGLEVAMAWGPAGHIQNTAVTYLDSSQKKAVEAFAAGRAINAAASILKSTEVTPVVVRFAPLEVLEPVDDLAKQFSDIMALSIAAILLQRLILVVSQTWAFSVALPVGCVLWLLAVCSYRWPALGLRLSGLGRGIVVLAVFARLVIPLAGWAGHSLTERFLAGDLNKAVATMDAARGSLEQITSKTVPPNDPLPAGNQQSAPAVPGPNITTPPSWWDRVTSSMNSTTAEGAALLDAVKSWLPNRRAFSAIGKALEGVPDQIVTAIEIFLVQTIFTPLAVAALLYSALGNVIKPSRLTAPQMLPF